MEQLWERSEEGRKETNRKPSTRTRKEGMRDQAGEKGETEEARAEAGTGKTTVRRDREEKERKKQRLSSEMLKRKRTEREAEVRHRPRRRDSKGDHLWNGCGSEAGQDERKRAARLSKRTGKECMRNQAGANGETEEARAEAASRKAAVRRNCGRTERKKQEAE